jgi:dTDP-4-dehydrorhamnose 3,5-epimerase
MEFIRLELSGLILVRPRVHGDHRGFFLETFRETDYTAAGVDVRFVQDNHSRSVQGTLRGLHYQSTPGQAKLVRVARGRIFDVAVDIRPESPTFGKWCGAYLDDVKHEQLYVPVGFAHGFCVVSEFADVVYKVSAPYDAATECSIRFDDSDINVRWPDVTPLLSARDEAAPSFAAFRAGLRGMP